MFNTEQLKQKIKFSIEICGTIPGEGSLSCLCAYKNVLEWISWIEKENTNGLVDESPRITGTNRII
jgi:hypothetical protein